MFIHCVLFRISKRNVAVYKRDCRLWEKEARRQAGFLGYRTLARTNGPGQYASFYTWKTESGHRRFMKKHHDRLVSLSRCPVEVLGYYDFQAF